MQLHGQVASILKCKQTINFVMRECSSRITVQFLDEIDRNHESQLRKFLKNFRDIVLLDIWHIIVNCNKKIHIYIYYIYPNTWKLLEFPPLGEDIRNCSLKMSTKLFKLIFLYQRTKSQRFF